MPVVLSETTISCDSFLVFTRAEKQECWNPSVFLPGLYVHQCAELTTSGCQVPASHSLSSAKGGEGKYDENE